MYNAGLKGKSTCVRRGGICLWAMVLLTWAGAGHAQTVKSPEDEYKKRVRVNEDVQPLGGQPFGERVSLDDGSLSFEQTDVSAVGNGPPLQLSCKFQVEGDLSDMHRADDAFGDWSIALPHLKTLTGSGFAHIISYWTQVNGWQGSGADLNAGCPVNRPQTITQHPGDSTLTAFDRDQGRGHTLADSERTFASDGVHALPRERVLFDLCKANVPHWGNIHCDTYKEIDNQLLDRGRRTMQRVVSLVTVVVLALGFESATYGGEQVKGYIYDAVGKDVNLAIVIDVTAHEAGIQDRKDAHIGTGSLVAGAYEDCSNSAFHCLTGPLEIVIPKAEPIARWKYHGLSCQGIAQAGGDAYRITCQSPKYRGRPTYMYSLSRGVVSIESSPLGGDHRYDLRGEHGLFFDRGRRVGGDDK